VKTTECARCGLEICSQAYSTVHASNWKLDVYCCDECKDDYTNDKKETPTVYWIHGNKKAREISKTKCEEKSLTKRAKLHHVELQSYGPKCFCDGVIEMFLTYFTDREKLLIWSLVCKRYRNTLIRSPDVWINADTKNLSDVRNFAVAYNVPLRPIPYAIKTVIVSVKMAFEMKYTGKKSDATSISFWPKTLDAVKGDKITIHEIENIFGIWPWRILWTKFHRPIIDYIHLQNLYQDMIYLSYSDLTPAIEWNRHEQEGIH